MSKEAKQLVMIKPSQVYDIKRLQADELLQRLEDDAKKVVPRQAVFKTASVQAGMDRIKVRDKWVRG